MVKRSIALAFPKVTDVCKPRLGSSAATKNSPESEVIGRSTLGFVVRSDLLGLSKVVCRKHLPVRCVPGTLPQGARAGQHRFDARECRATPAWTPIESSRPCFY